jgi:hypothetical protein
VIPKLHVPYAHIASLEGNIYEARKLDTRRYSDSC